MHCCSCLISTLSNALLYIPDTYRVPTRQGKMEFCKREMSGNFDECQGNLKNKAQKSGKYQGILSRLSGNFHPLGSSFMCASFF